MPIRSSLVQGLLIVGILLVTLTLARSSLAEDRVVVWTEGRTPSHEPADVEHMIRALLPPEVQVVERSAFRSALRTQGINISLGNRIAFDAYRAAAVTAVRKALEQVDASAAIVARLRVNKKLEPEVFLLHVPRDGEVGLDLPVTLDDDVMVTLIALREAIAPAFEWPEDSLEPAPPPDRRATPAPVEPKAAPAPVPSPAPDEPPDAPAATPNEPEPHMAILSVRAGYQIAGRRFRYDEPRTFNLRPYDLFGAHLVNVAFEAYPFAGIPVAEHFGVLGEYAIAPVLDSDLPDGSQVSSSFDMLRTGLRARLRTGAPPAPILHAQGTFGWHRFRFSSENNLFFSQLPDVWYVYGGVGLGALLPLWRFGLFAEASYLAPLSGGLVAARFRDTTIHGLNARAGLSFAIIDELELQTAADYVTMFYSFGTQPLDEYVASGARDEFVAVQASLVYHFLGGDTGSTE